MRKLFTILFLFVCLSANAVEKKTNFSEKIFENAKASGKTVVSIPMKFGAVHVVNKLKF